MFVSLAVVVFVRLKRLRGEERDAFELVREREK
jgi:hypothetical protein